MRTGRELLEDRRELLRLRNLRRMATLGGAGGNTGIAAPIASAVGPTVPMPEPLAGTGGGGVPTILVAAFDSEARTQAYADYVCDGTADDVEINAALDELTTWGGRVVLSEGQFNVTAMLTVASGQSLMGMSSATFIQSSAQFTISTVGYAVIRDFTLYGPNTDSSVGIALDDLDRLFDVEVGDCQTAVQVGSGATGVQVRGCNLFGHSAPGVSGTSASVDVAGEEAVVTDCLLYRDVRVSGLRNIIANNRFDVSADPYIRVTGGSNNCITGNFLPGGSGRFVDSGTTTQRGTNFALGATW